MTKGNVFISGASRGIGKTLAYQFANNGFTVVGTSRTEFEYDKKLENLIPIQLDVTSRDDIKTCFNELKEQGLLPNILINNAGITSDQLFLRMKDEDWDNVINTNLNGVFNLSKIFIKNMVKNKAGRIINISSIHSSATSKNISCYASTKACI